MAFRDLMPWRSGGMTSRAGEGEQYPMDSLHREINRVFEDFFRDMDRPWGLAGAAAPAVSMPRIDVTEDEHAWHVEAELPGLERKDVELGVEDGVLTISGQKKQESEEKKKDYYRRERSYGSFHRALALPGGVDETKIKASMKNGVLSIDLPKSEQAKQKYKRIEIEAK